MNASSISDRAAVRSLIITSILTLLLNVHSFAQGTPSNSWILFDDSVAMELELRDTQLERLKEIDARFQVDLSRSGADPGNDPNHMALTERRNAEIATVLDAEQFDAWTRMNGLENEDSRSRPGFGPAGADMDRRDPQTPIRERDAGNNNTGGAVKGGSDR